MAIKLTKNGEETKISLVKKDDATPVTVHCNLSWKAAVAPAPAPKKSGGLFGGLFGGSSTPAAPKNEDLDLGCMWQDRRGGKGVIQALGKNFGDKANHPFILLDKDDRSGASADGENLTIYRPTDLQRILIFAYIYDGSAFSAVAAKITIKLSNGQQVDIELDAPSRDQSFCGAAMIEVSGTDVTIRKENRYFKGHEACDKGFGFGFNWSRASK